MDGHHKVSGVPCCGEDSCPGPCLVEGRVVVCRVRSEVLLWCHVHHWQRLHGREEKLLLSTYYNRDAYIQRGRKWNGSGLLV